MQEECSSWIVHSVELTVVPHRGTGVKGNLSSFLALFLQRCVRQTDWASLPFGAQHESVWSVSITADAEQQWTLGSCRGRCLHLTTLEGNRKSSVCALAWLGAAKEQKHIKRYSAWFKRKWIEPEAGRFKNRVKLLYIDYLRKGVPLPSLNDKHNLRWSVGLIAWFPGSVADNILSGGPHCESRMS